MSQELVRIVDNIARDKNIDRESIFFDLEEAMVSAVRKHFGEPESEIEVNIDRTTGEMALTSPTLTAYTHMRGEPGSPASPCGTHPSFWRKLFRYFPFTSILRSRKGSAARNAVMNMMG